MKKNNLMLKIFAVGLCLMNLVACTNTQSVTDTTDTNESVFAKDKYSDSQSNEPQHSDLNISDLTLDFDGLYVKLPIKYSDLDERIELKNIGFESENENIAPKGMKYIFSNIYYNHKNYGAFLIIYEETKSIQDGYCVGYTALKSEGEESCNLIIGDNNTMKKKENFVSAFDYEKEFDVECVVFNDESYMWAEFENDNLKDLNLSINKNKYADLF